MQKEVERVTTGGREADVYVKSSVGGKDIDLFNSIIKHCRSQVAGDQKRFVHNLAVGDEGLEQ